MHSMATLANPAFLCTVDVKVMQILISIPEPGRFTGSLKEECVLVVTVEAKRKIFILVWDVEFSRIKGLQERFIIRHMWRMAIPAVAVGNRFMLGDRVIVDLLDADMASDAGTVAGEDQHGGVIAAMGRVAEIATTRCNRAVYVLAFRGTVFDIIETCNESGLVHFAEQVHGPDGNSVNALPLGFNSLAIHNFIMTKQTELASGLQHEGRKISLVRIMATGTPFC